MAEILFVEDDAMIAAGLEYALAQEGHQVTWRADVRSALEAIEKGTFALGLLDLGLPDGTGYDLCRRLREKGTPVIFLTAVDDEANAVKGLEMGAEDYIVKPFRLRELMARIQAVLRRHGAGEGAVLRIGEDIQVHPHQAKVYRRGVELELTALEYRLLLVFLNHRGQVLTRAQLLEGIWDVDGSFVGDNTLTVYVRRLREKLGDDGQSPALIKTVRGMGYRLDA